ncbi:phosphoribosylformylglycinamidine cyclo-ligase [Patescibacteria group bacterium]|nr:phosphoribosylformylglycinamidine cyclo-ligase [Patescibacteria group bacterium]MBU1015896.1 phosphoribosylformylglycinamidine cyclo-ligase [Patescibacteria group bacterium]MBU1685065.1 phosphoribosylformylglycinamidine cyclo-ligase [Patescibacteria group bacterium]MBU1938172.1 phosphoribosylformylglycinamidine cyclo-ligase [Patescibacteria group bacterium]
MATYKESGVDVELGDRCSRAAYSAAKGTFAGRKGMIGQPVTDEGGFAGLLDMGDFYLAQNDDGVGTKIEVAEKMRKFDTLGYDLVAMVADDAICMGAEVISVSNTLDAPKLDAEMVEGLMAGLQKAALEQKIVVPGGELAELSGALNGAVWNATAVGIVAKDRVLSGAGIQIGDAIIGLKSVGIRSNGMSLARMILSKQFGENWVAEKYDNGRTWGEVILTPSKIYHAAILNIIGRYGESKKHPIKGIVHNTGGGIRGNLPRLLKKHGFGAKLDSLIEPHDFMLRLMELGQVSVEEAYKTWNMGVGMMMVTGSESADGLIAALAKEGVKSQVIGYVTGGEEIQF